MGELSRDELLEVRKELLSTIRDGHAAISSQLEKVDGRITTRLDRMNGSISKAHERAGRLETAVESVQREVQDARSRWRQRCNEISSAWMAKAGDHEHKEDAGDGRVIRIADIKVLVLVIGGTVGVVIGLLELMGRL